MSRPPSPPPPTPPRRPPGSRACPQVEEGGGRSAYLVRYENQNGHRLWRRNGGGETGLGGDVRFGGMGVGSLLPDPPRPLPSGPAGGPWGVSMAFSMGSVRRNRPENRTSPPHRSPQSAPDPGVPRSRKTPGPGQRTGVPRAPGTPEPMHTRGLGMLAMRPHTLDPPTKAKSGHTWVISEERPKALLETPYCH